MLGEKYTLDIRPTFIDELDRAAVYNEEFDSTEIDAKRRVAYLLYLHFASLQPLSLW